MRCNTKVLSNVWWPVTLSDDSWEKPLALWLNSSLGILLMLAHRTSTRGSWVANKKADLQVQPVLDFKRISSAKLTLMSNLFDELAGLEFKSLPEMAACDTRTALADRHSEILGVPHVGALLSLISSEPDVPVARL